MSPSEELVARYYAAFNAREFELYDQLFSPDVEIQFPGVSTSGVEAMRGFDMGWVEAFPAAQLDCLRLTTTGNQVAGVIWFRGGPQRGVVNTPAGSIPARGKTLECPGFVIFDVAGGRLTRQQIGIEPAWIQAQLGGAA